MLIYHPAYDAYHGIFRILKILNGLPSSKSFHVDRIRIYDFYFLFPNQLEFVSLPIHYSKYKKILENNKYNKIPNAKSAFYQIEPIQNLSLKSLASFSLIDSATLNEERVVRTSVDIPDGLLSDNNNVEQKYLELITTCFESMSLKELKKRTALMEYRYELS